jgi:hypothetical protein
VAAEVDLTNWMRAVLIAKTAIGRHLLTYVRYVPSAAATGHRSEPPSL